ncbi:MAG: 4Fe-4S binding protein [Magnetococcales bacterium]|nr:4Fe-4S binding protein [Magnetococcales bacterium]
MTCRDQCEPRAISFNPVIGGLSPPILDSDLCNGCGACIAPCPSKAINIALSN